MQKIADAGRLRALVVYVCGVCGGVCCPLQSFEFMCVRFRDISPAPSAPVFIWVSTEMTAIPKDGIEGVGSATAALHWFMGGSHRTQGVILMKAIE